MPPGKEYFPLSFPGGMASHLRVAMSFSLVPKRKKKYNDFMYTKEGYRKLCKRFDEDGQAHYLTFTCFHHQPFLQSDRCRYWLVDSIKSAQIKHPFDLWAWVFMPEHVHLLVFPHKGIQIRNILASIKIPVTRRAANFVQKEAPSFIPRMVDIQPNGQKALRFWQRGGGYDRNILSINELHEKIQYIHKNPVRRELVIGPEDWFWSSYRAWEKNVDNPLKIDYDTLPPLNQR
jgi:putative transposase